MDPFKKPGDRAAPKRTPQQPPKATPASSVKPSTPQTPKTTMKGAPKQVAQSVTNNTAKVVVQLPQDVGKTASLLVEVTPATNALQPSTSKPNDTVTSTASDAVPTAE